MFPQRYVAQTPWITNVLCYLITDCVILNVTMKRTCLTVMTVPRRLTSVDRVMTIIVEGVTQMASVTYSVTQRRARGTVVTA